MTISPLIIREIIGYASRNGVPLSGIFSNLGIQPESLNDLNLPFKVDQLHTLLKYISQQTGDPYVLFHYIEEAPLSLKNLNLLSFLIQKSSTIEEGMEKFCGYLNLYAVFTRIEVSSVKESFLLTFTPLKPWLDEYPDYARQSIEARMIATTMLLEKLTGALITPKQMLSTFSPPSNGMYPSSILNFNVQFDQNINGLYYHKSELEQTRIIYNQSLLNLKNRIFESMLVELGNGEDFSDKVRRVILKLFIQEKSADFTNVSSYLGISIRTLERRLKEDGRNLQLLKNDIRKHLSIRLLHSKAATIEEIAYLLGFPNLEAFKMAFKNWVGTIPRDYLA